ncbi:hypothetical protein CAAN1_26S00166 [[Candida] anglica]|uniref:Uncharacterized protein n=1 Tax=[Candida] anglica TaxID=148631 RepID=A0ABP0EKB4_9ASCO
MHNSIKLFEKYINFSKQPLNYETWLNRLSLLHKQRRPLPQSLRDCITSARSLERQYKDSHKLYRHDTRYHDLLSLSGPNSLSDVEYKLVETLDKYPLNDEILTNYLLCDPIPQNSSKIIQWTKQVLQNSSRESADDVSNQTSIVWISLRTLLHSKDYHNAFNLIDETIGSDQYIDSHMEKLFIRIGKNGFALLLCSALMSIISHSMMIGGLWLGIGFGLSYGFHRLHYPFTLNRVSWRPHCGLLYRLKREQELFLVDKIITHYEEHSEVNIRNFHHSEVREIPNLQMFEQNNGHILEAPPDNDQSSLELMFREQISKRRLVLNDLQEELMFLDYWLAQGEDYDWVEPDQDPAEIIKLKTQQE